MLLHHHQELSEGTVLVVHQQFLPQGRLLAILAPADPTVLDHLLVAAANSPLSTTPGPSPPPSSPASSPQPTKHGGQRLVVSAIL